MKPSDQLSEFVQHALAQGGDRDGIAHALAAAGWSAPEIEEALESWASVPGLPPVPRPRPYASAQEALLYGLLFLSLGVIVWHLCQLGAVLIDWLIPDPFDGPHYGWDSSVRWSIASLIAFVPLFLGLNRKVARMSVGDAGKRRSLVRKWFASLTLLVVALVFLGDGVLAIFALLNGDLTLRFAAKAVLVAGVAALVFAYYRDELDD
ncbi:hypothetical protein F8A10_00890 [Paracoccus kondratievae]|uniref:DUF5671 domain-containing protein n=1 Tax=Paracoccus kondratievae TaxID=135740 RepID=A0AAD3NSF3_9RHOB|nr:MULTISPECIES: DUF5671 domain-containing protein [Paracoccus]QFQ86096.1 hypothetical protein F8A10_00890 [Paracoccus kondratievae]GLK62936.1 hypothetical protein GCM10017635_04050 [Paracoccus kondratievae]